MQLKLLKPVNQYFVSIIIIATTVFFCIPIQNSQAYHVVSFILLFVVSILATFLSIGPVLIAATLSSLVWNYFFIPPNFTFHIDKTEDILMFSMFFIVAFINGIFTVRVRRQEQLAREREHRTYALFNLTKELSKVSGIDTIVNIASENIKNIFFTEPVFFLQDGKNNLIIPSGHEITKTKAYDVTALALFTFKNTKSSGAFTNNFQNCDYTFYPLPGTRVVPGVIAIKNQKQMPADVNVFWDTFLSQIANALEREFLGEIVNKSRILAESDKLYKTLFNSISHELRIPVATIMGASDTLINNVHPENVKNTLVHEIFNASIRLNQLIENLLNISRLESGRITPRFDWYDINDLVFKVCNDLANELKPFNLSVSIPDNFPLVKIDFGLIEQVLYNLLLNATQHAPAASDISVIFEHYKTHFLIKIIDNGPGFSNIAIENIFQKFYRQNNNKTGGLGLGLSIVKGFVQAHKGTVVVNNNPGGGAVFTLTIPTQSPDIDNF